MWKIELWAKRTTHMSKEENRFGKQQNDSLNRKCSTDLCCYIVFSEKAIFIVVTKDINQYLTHFCTILKLPQWIMFGDSNPLKEKRRRYFQESRKWHVTFIGHAYLNVILCWCGKFTFVNIELVANLKYWTGRILHT